MGIILVAGVFEATTTAKHEPIVGAVGSTINCPVDGSRTS